MLDNDRVHHWFLFYAGMEEPAPPEYRSFCAASAEALAARLKDGVDLSRQMERLCIAAGGLAYCDWCELSTASADEHEIRVGDITMRSPASAWASAKDLSTLREDFVANIADLLKPRLVFRQVDA